MKTRMDSGTPITIHPSQDLLPEDLERALSRNHNFLELNESVVEVVEKSRHTLERIVERGDPLYGLSTGFGPFVERPSTLDQDSRSLGLLYHLNAGAGEDIPTEVVRGAMLLRINSLSRGYSGISLNTLQGYTDFLNSGLVAAVPEIGSLGASGDLIPLSHIASAVCGSGWVRENGIRVPSQERMKTLSLKPLHLTGRDALALVNGTSVSAAWAALSWPRINRLLERAEILTGWLHSTLGATLESLDPLLMINKRHPGSMISAENIRRAASTGSRIERDMSRPLQEIYSIRCAPQALGACRDLITNGYSTLVDEMNGVDDNPLIDPDGEGRGVHGGNFYGQHLAFLCDTLKMAVI